MKKYILFLLLPFLACSKDDNKASTAELLQGKMWLVDSTYTIKNGVRSVAYPQAQTFLKVRYNNNGTYDIYASYDTPQSKKYELAGMIIYYWDPASQKSVDQYTTIEKITSSLLHTSQIKPSGEKFGYYSHPE
jgi:hypothetical protein